MQKESMIYGLHAVKMLLVHSPHRVKLLYLEEGREDRFSELLALCMQSQLPVEFAKKEMLNTLAPDAVHQGIIALLYPLSQTMSVEDLLQSLITPAFLLILDGVQDPHNLGACLRSANAAGIQAVIAPRDRAVGLTSVVRKVACGAAEITPFIQVTNLARTIDELKEAHIWVYGTAEEAQESLYTMDLTGPLALVLGAEGSGLRRLTRERCDKLVKIPTAGVISSLNVSVATGVCIFEAFRQRSREKHDQ